MDAARSRCPRVTLQVGSRPRHAGGTVVQLLAINDFHYLNRRPPNGRINSIEPAAREYWRRLENAAAAHPDSIVVAAGDCRRRRSCRRCFTTSRRSRRSTRWALSPRSAIGILMATRDAVPRSGAAAIRRMAVWSAMVSIGARFEYLRERPERRRAPLFLPRQSDRRWREDRLSATFTGTNQIAKAACGQTRSTLTRRRRRMRRPPS